MVQKRPPIRGIISWILVGIIVILSGVIVFSGYSRITGKNVSHSFPEEKELLRADTSFRSLSSFFQRVAKAKGAVYAFDLLLVAKLPANTDLHLLGHVVGDELYKQQGAAGITHCTDDFRNACSHAIVGGIYNDRGEKGFSEIVDACRNAPGGKGAYGMCFHGLGHGILASIGYDVNKAIPLCRAIGSPENYFIESSQCISGVVMEIIGGGFHDRTTWEKQRTKYIDPGDPLSPCTLPTIPSEAKPLCYLYLTPRLIEYAGGNLGKPTADDFKRSILLCNTIPSAETENRDSCFGGFGKEYVGLVKDRDIRKSTVSAMTESDFKHIEQWCQFAQSPDGISSCIRYATNTLYWGGENGADLPLRFCSMLGDERLKNLCFTNLIGAIHFYDQGTDKPKQLCHNFQEPYREQCENFVPKQP